MSVVIYLIRNSETGKVYVGSTSNFTSRKAQHRSKLRLGKHDNHGMMADCISHGLSSFEFIVAERVISEEDRYEREQDWIDYMRMILPSEHLYNMQPFAGKTRGRPVSEETRRKMSESQKKRERSDRQYDGIRRANIGRVFTPETRKKISDAHLRRPPEDRKVTSVLNKDQVIDIFTALLSGATLASQAKKYGVGTSTIYRIKAGQSWSDVTGKLKEVG